MRPSRRTAQTPQYSHQKLAPQWRYKNNIFQLVMRNSRREKQEYFWGAVVNELRNQNVGKSHIYRSARPVWAVYSIVELRELVTHRMSQ